MGGLCFVKSRLWLWKRKLHYCGENWWKPCFLITIIMHLGSACIQKAPHWTSLSCVTSSLLMSKGNVAQQIHLCSYVCTVCLISQHKGCFKRFYMKCWYFRAGKASFVGGLYFLNIFIGLFENFLVKTFGNLTLLKNEEFKMNTTDIFTNSVTFQ